MFGSQHLNEFDIKPNMSGMDIKDMWDVDGIRDKAKKGNFEAFDFSGFKPFILQVGKYQRIEKRPWVYRAQIIEPRRAGKTIFNVIYLIIKSLEKLSTTKFPFLRYGLIYPDLTQAKEVAWDAFEYYTRGFQRDIRKNQGHIDVYLRNMGGEMTKIMYRLVGLKNYDSRRGGFYDGAILDEKKDIPSGFKPIINPMVSDPSRQPTFLFNTGTPDDSDDFWGDYDNWRAKEMAGDDRYFTFWTNYELLKKIGGIERGYLSEHDYMLATEGMSQAEIDIEYGCKRGVKTGASFFGDLVRVAEERNRIRMIEDIEDEQKIVCNDIGSTKKDLYALWVSQYNRFNGAIEVIDYHEMPKATEEKVVQWLLKKHYNVKQMILPWDAAVGMTTPVQNFQRLMPNTRMTPLPKPANKMERISSLRRCFKRFHFDLRNTARGIICLKRYSKVWDRKNKVYLVKPKHDEYSHGADALTYYAQALERDQVDLTSGKIGDRGVSKSNASDYEPMLDWHQGSKDALFANAQVQESRLWLGEGL